MPRAKQRTPELRAEVLRVAVDTVAAEGVAALTARRVAAGAGTSTPAVYELFGDKAGLVREVVFEGFASLRQRFDRLRLGDDPRRDLLRTLHAFRDFARDNPALAQLMFARGFADLDPGPADRAAGEATRRFVVERVRRCIAAGVIRGDDRDVAHALLALAQGLAAQESAGWLGRSRASRDRRWDVAVRAMLDGLATRA